MVRLINALRDKLPKEVGGIKVEEVRDYLDYHGPVRLPKENVLQFILEGKSWFCIRPSGTEPKLKIYYSVIGNDWEDAGERMARLRAGVEAIVKVR